ncbi:OmpW/AlkL family protein [Sphingomonas sp. DT-51]|uniref:OmpW/AlkL family protein n=1 Tax=Sphingomonas sp. DT-51 TaxID=3396165 RepID=UPI003F19ED8B
MKRVFEVLLSAALAMSPSSAYAKQAPSWLINVGVTRLSMADDASVALAGVTVPGGGVASDAQLVPSLSVTRFIASDLGVSLSTGLPPTINYRGEGSLAAAGSLLDVRYAAPAATLIWSPLRARTLNPYVGAGVTYMHVLSTHDRTLTSATVDDDIGPVLQAGISVFPHRRWGAFVDVKKAYVRTEARGAVTGYPAATRLRMDPVVLQTGVAIRL